MEERDQREMGTSEGASKGSGSAETATEPTLTGQSDSSRRDSDPAPFYIRHSALGLALTLLTAALGLFVYQAITWPDVRRLNVEAPDTTAFIERYRERSEPGDAPLRWIWVPYDSISIHAKRAFVVGEDIGFFSHDGFAYEEILVAIREAIAGDRELRGASTITQQVAKNLFLWNGKSFVRKGIEAYFAVLIELLWTKRRILEVYLNVAEFGKGVYGIGAASRKYFHKVPRRLRRYECALLAAVLPNPTKMRLDRPSAYMLQRADSILMEMNRLDRIRPRPYLYRLYAG